jgi:hypothetical protein
MSNSCNIALHVYGMNAPKGYKFDLFYHQLSNSHLNTLPFYTARLDFNLITMKLIAVLFFAALAAAAPLDPAESKRHCWGLFLNCDYSDGSQCYNSHLSKQLGKGLCCQRCLHRFRPLL